MLMLKNRLKMKKYFCITIDVEPDCSIAWNRSSPLAFDNIETGIRDILHPLFERHNIKPAYIISPEVLSHQPSVEILKNLQDCELGAAYGRPLPPSARKRDARGR